MSEIIGLIKKLGEIPGVSGHEGAVRDEITALTKDSCDSYEVDALGNLLIFKKGAKRPENRIMLSAHMDEVGLIVTHIEEDGLLRFAPVGGLDPRMLYGKVVEIGPARLPGVIGGRAMHHLTDKERETVPEIEKLLIDVGAADRHEAEKHVTPGDRAVFSGPFLELGGNYIMGKALDDRAGCALLIGLLRKKEPLPYDCHFVFTVQEETGCTGALTAAYAIRPDIGIIVETTTGADLPGTTPEQKICRLGEGPVVTFMDKGTVYDKELYDLAFSLAKRKGLKCQTKSAVAGGNESRSVQTAGSGARVMAVSLPCRYLHSPSLVIHKDDVEETYKLLEALIEELGFYPNSR